MGNERYYRRKRFIYALVFPTGGVYIGQSVNLKRRWSEHASFKGGWGNLRFKPYYLFDAHCTFAEAEDLEQAYRVLAREKGYFVYGLPQVVVNPHSRATEWHYRQAKRLPWPVKRPRQKSYWQSAMELLLGSLRKLWA